MMYIVLSALASALFGSGYKVATILRAQRVGVNVCMLAVATVLSAVIALLYERAALTGTTVGIGASAGVCLFLTTTAFFQVMRYGRLAIQWTVLNMAVAIPTGVSIVVWNEQPTVLLGAGMVLTVIALVLMGIDRGQNLHQDTAESSFNPALGRRANLKWLGLVAFAFMTTGLVQVCNKALIQYGAADAKFAYTGICFGVAGVLATVYMLSHGVRPRWVDAALGSGMGLGVTLATIFMLYALEVLPGIVVFPARIVFVIVFTTGLSVLFWHERVHWQGALGLVMAAVAISCFGVG